MNRDWIVAASRHASTRTAWTMRTAAWTTQKKSNYPTFPTLKTRTGRSAIKRTRSVATEPKPTGTARRPPNRPSRRSLETPANETTATMFVENPTVRTSSTDRRHISLTDVSIPSGATWSATASGTSSPAANFQFRDRAADRLASIALGHVTGRDPSRRSETTTGEGRIHRHTMALPDTGRQLENILRCHRNIPDHLRWIAIATISTSDHRRPNQLQCEVVEVGIKWTNLVSSID